MAPLRDELFGYIRDTYGAECEYPWLRYPDYAVFRHGDNKKWFALVMNLPRNRLGLPGAENTDVLNVKLDDLLLRDILLRQAGCFPGYHISRGNWISVLLDGTVPMAEIARLVDVSYRATASAERKRSIRGPKEWLVPANPKYYDVVHAFDGAEVINWKQGSGIRRGDTVFLYVAVPYSCILFRCRVEETDIPYHYADGDLTIRRLMKIRLERRYAEGLFSFERLKEAFGIFAVRGPRGVPHALSEALKR